MPFTYQSATDGRMAAVVLVGQASADDFTEMIQALFEDPDFSRTSRRLYDARRLSELVVAEDAMPEILAPVNTATSMFGAGGRTAVVTHRGALAAMAHLFGHHLHDRTLEVFTSLEAAIAWLQTDLPVESRWRLVCDAA